MYIPMYLKFTKQFGSVLSNLNRLTNILEINFYIFYANINKYIISMYNLVSEIGISKTHHILLITVLMNFECIYRVDN